MGQIKSDSGFQLLDAMLVVALLLVVVSMSLDRVGRYSDLSRLQEAGEILNSELNRARTLAISHNVSVAFRLEQARSAYSLEAEDGRLIWHLLPDGVELLVVPRRTLQFHSRGTAAPAGTIVIGNRAGQVRIAVSPAGRIRTEEEFQ